MGYTTIKATAGQNLVAVSFAGLDGSDVDIQSITHPDFTEMDSLMVLEGGKYVPYLWRLHSYDSATFTDCGPGWTDAMGVRVKLPLKPGTAFWLRTAKDLDFTISGAVLTESQIIDAPSGSSLVASSFPVDVPVNDGPMTISNLQADDSILVYNSQTKKYEATFLYKEETYVIEGGNKFTNAGPGWADGMGIRASASIPANTAFWLITKNPVRVEIDSPLE